MSAHEMGRDRRHRGMIEDEDAAIGKLGSGAFALSHLCSALIPPRLLTGALKLCTALLSAPGVPMDV